MKASKYNLFFQDYNGNYYAYNGLSGGVLQVSWEVNQKIQEILLHLGDPLVKIEEDREDRVRDYLYQGSFILDDEVDELEILKARNRMVRFSGNRLYLTIATTQSCNFRCTYCFQNHSDESMKSEVADLLVDFVATSVKSCEELHVHWYGGEPLLTLSMIRDLSSRFKDICQACNCNYTASMSTNGFLLNEKIALELSQLNIERVRVTLDGPSDIHDKRRPLINGLGTFWTIIDNVTAATKHMTVRLRVNIDRNNFSHISELLDILKSKGLGKEVLFEFVPVTPFTSTCQDNCYSIIADRELIDVTKNIYKEVINRGLGFVSSSLTNARHCTFDDVNSYLIDTDGKMYKCFKEEKFCVGQLDNSDPKKFKSNYLHLVNLISIDPFDNLKCRECGVLPMCMGGCTLKRLKFGNESACPEWKNNPEDHILLNIVERINQPIR